MTKKKIFFGTDGIRGPANVGILTPDNIMRFGMAAGKYFLRAQHTQTLCYNRKGHKAVRLYD